MKRLVRASKKDSEDCKKLLRLMGVPYVEVDNACEMHTYVCICVWVRLPVCSR